MSPSTDRQTFRDVVAQVAEKARAKLPPAVNGRIESAVKLVLLHDVMPQPDGSILVGSSRDPLRSYLLQGSGCECQDFTRGKAPDGWCQHRIAAGLHKRVTQLLATPPVPVVPERVPEPFPDNDPEPAPEMPVPESPAVPLPEAPASVNCHILLEGRQVQLTLRDSDEARLLERLQAVLAQYPVPQPPPQASSPLTPQQHNAAAMHKRITDFCQIHNVAMQLNQKDGRSWHSHRLPEGGWCKGK